jgi:N-acetyl-beta-hexosaminidase
MLEMMIGISVDEVAKVITAMNEQKMETLTLLLTDEATELLERKKDLELTKVKFLTREEAFDG